MNIIKAVSIIRKKPAISSPICVIPACPVGIIRYTLSIFHKKEGVDL
jgi:hypothetical protein